MRQFISIFCFLAMAIAAEAQVKMLVATDADPVSVDMGYALTESIERDFDVRILVLSPTDPAIREALLEGKLNAVPEKPTAALAREAAQRLGCSYALWVVARRNDQQQVAATVEVFRPNSNRAVFRGRTDAADAGTNSLLSITSDWSRRLETGAFKQYKRVAPTESPLAGPIDSTPVSDNPPPANQGVSSQFIDEASRLRQAGKTDEAVSALYRGTDLAPFDLDIRLALIELLQGMARESEAADVIESTLQLFPGEKKLRHEAVRLLLDRGKIEEAQDALNESLVRDPEDPALWQLSGEFALMRLQGDRARGQFLRVMAQGASPRTQLCLAIAVALEGDSPETEHLLKSAQAETLAYRRWLQVSQLFAAQASQELAEVMRLRRLGNANLAQRTQRALQQTRALAIVATRMPVPAGQKADQNHALAHNLLAQAAGQVAEFVRTGNDDIAGDAEISISDAMRRFAAIAASR